jgi:CheY-like chemotaxis protein
VRVLVVEDDQDFLATILEALRGEVPGIELLTARSRDSALLQLPAGPFDLVICDLKIPTQDGALDEDLQHGLAVHGRCREVAPGTPVLVLTAFGTLAIDQLAALLTDSPREVFVGKGRAVSMTDFVQKGKFGDFVAKVSAFAKQIAQLEDVEIVTEPPALVLSFGAKRTLRIMASRKGGRQVRVTELGGGLSSAQILRVRVSNEEGVTTALAVAKLGRLKTLESEQVRYERHVLPLLQPGSFAARLDEVRVGAGDAGGLFYSLADEFDRCIFDVLAADPQAGAALVPIVRALEGRWRDSAQQRTRSVGEVRRSFVSDEDLAGDRQALDQMGCSRFEERDVVFNQCCQHRDLHGLNVLVGRDGRPLLIDYGEVDISAASHDAISLELSLLFHPKGRATVGAWPTPDQARRWAHVEEYVKACPVADFVRACRTWAHDVSAGPREVYVQAYSYSLRQLPYADTPKPIALAVAAAAMEAF